MTARPTAGLGVASVTLVVLAASIVAGALDLLLGDSLGWFFGTVFVLSCLFAAARIRPGDLLAALILPPLIFAAAELVALRLVAGGGSLVDTVASLGQALALGAPILFTGTFAAAILTGIRAVALARARRRMVRRPSPRTV